MTPSDCMQRMVSQLGKGLLGGELPQIRCWLSGVALLHNHNLFDGHH